MAKRILERGLLKPSVCPVSGQLQQGMRFFEQVGPLFFFLRVAGLSPNSLVCVHFFFLQPLWQEAGRTIALLGDGQRLKNDRVFAKGGHLAQFESVNRVMNSSDDANSQLGPWRCRVVVPRAICECDKIALLQIVMPPKVVQNAILCCICTRLQHK